MKFAYHFFVFKAFLVLVSQRCEAELTSSPLHSSLSAAMESHFPFSLELMEGEASFWACCVALVGGKLGWVHIYIICVYVHVCVLIYTPHTCVCMCSGYMVV